MRTLNMKFPRAGATRPALHRHAVRAYIPDTLTDDRLLGPDPDYGAYLVSHLYLERHLDRRYKDGSYIPMHSEIMRQILPRGDYKTILSGLRDNGIIECNDSYQRGEAGRRGRSTGY